MRKKIKIAALLVIAALLTGTLAGCVDQDIKVGFADDGSVSFSVANLVAQSWFDATGTDPRTQYKDEIESGGTLISKTIGKETYYGMAPEVLKYDTLEEFLGHVEGTDGLSVTAESVGGYIQATINVDIPSKEEVETGTEENGAARALADKMVKVLNVYFPQGIVEYGGNYAVSISEDRKSLEATLYPYGDAYTFHVTGFLSKRYVVNTTLRIGKPEAGWTPAELMREARLDTNPRGAADLSEAQWEWYIVNKDGRKTEMDPNEEFRTGTTYAFGCTTWSKEGYLVCEQTEAFVWDQSSKGRYISGLETDMLYYEAEYSVPGAGGWDDVQPAPDVTPIFNDTVPIMPDEPGPIYVIEKTLETVEVEADWPKVGMTYPEIKWSLKDDTGLDKDAVKLTWLERAGDSGSGAVNWSDMTEDQKFQAGHEYSVEFEMKLKEGWVIDNDTQALFNGQHAQIYGTVGSDKFALVYDLEPLKALGTLSPEDPAASPSQGPVRPGVPKASASGLPFTDVLEDAYYHDAVAWAYEHEPQITDGTSSTTFSPNITCTRGQVVTFLWRAAGCPEPVSSKNPFSDVAESDWFYKPVLWAVEKGITDGTSPTTFSPRNTCKNSHILTFIWRAMGEPGKTGEGAWWQDALNWAEGRGMLEGSYSGAYDVNADCSRANVVYYLWKMEN